MERKKEPSIRATVILVMTLAVFLAALTAGLFFYGKSRSLLTRDTRERIVQLLDQVNGRVEAQVGLIDTVFPMFSANPLISESLEPQSIRYDAPAMEKKLEIERQMNYLLINSYLWSERYVNAVYLFDGTNAYAVSRYRGGASEAQRNRDVAGRLLPEMRGLRIIASEPGDPSLYFCRNINSIYTGQVIASIVVDIDREAFQRSYSQGIDGGYVCLFGPEGGLLSSHGEPDSELTAAMAGFSGTGQFRLAGKTYFAASKRLDRSALTSTVAVPEEAVFGQLNETFLSFLAFLSVLIFLLLPVTALFSALITRPIKTMRIQVETLSAGARPKLPAGRYVEFRELYRALNTTLDERDQYYSELYEKKLLLKNAELKSLQTQINPHFLFNVLDTIGWKAAIAGEDEIYNMVVALGEMLRGNILAREEEEIRLQDELAYVKFYLYLQQARFEDKFTADLSIDPALAGCLVPRLSIQPFVENAIIHGLENKEGPGRLTVKACRRRDDLSIEITDDGVGFDPEKTVSPGREGHTHIAMKNVDRRVSLLYGPGYGLQIESAPGVGTTVRLRIPIHYERSGTGCTSC